MRRLGSRTSSIPSIQIDEAVHIYVVRLDFVDDRFYEFKASSPYAHKFGKKRGILNRDKIYHFIVSTGSSKSGYLGEASIDFADFVAETEPLTVTLPLKFANSGVVLHASLILTSRCNQYFSGFNTTSSICSQN
ncbi:hypothetical protein M0R45_038034 [Rubus argutus]|uniref:C2 NT-type domain-containing protein n=1 Tax=Rubus argutus TaxID=59490 RepID=A0AAW1W123_RUBAR